MAAKEAESYVIVHTMVDGWSQGTVVKREAFRVTSKDVQGKEHSEDTLERLVGLGAVRPATAEEARSGRGFVSGTAGLNPAAQMKFAAMDGEIDALRRRVSDQDERIRGLAGLGVKTLGKAAAEVKPEDDPSLAPLFEQRQAELEQLQELAKVNEKKLEGLAAAAAKPATAAAEAVPVATPVHKTK